MPGDLTPPERSSCATRPGAALSSLFAAFAFLACTEEPNSSTDAPLASSSVPEASAPTSVPSPPLSASSAAPPNAVSPQPATPDDSAPLGPPTSLPTAPVQPTVTGAPSSTSPPVMGTGGAAGAEPNTGGMSPATAGGADAGVGGAATTPLEDAGPSELPTEDAMPTEPEVYSPCPGDGAACEIMPLGDSITFGVGSSGAGGGYRVQLFRRALADGHVVTFVGTSQPNGPDTVEGQTFPKANQGHSGYAIDQGGFGSLSGVLDGALATTDPHIILLMIGTNDINGNVDLGNAPSRLAALVDKIVDAEPDALLVLAKIVPTTDSGINARVEMYNSAMDAIVEERATAGKHVVLVDLYAPFVDTPNFQSTLMDDTLHPNDAGYVVMADAWYDAIEAVLPAPASEGRRPGN